MIVYSSPGVYIQEVPAGPQPIAAAPTSVLAIVGTTQRGPRALPTRITSWGDFRAQFGDLVEGLHTAEAVFGYFENGGPAVHVVRVDPSASAEWNVLQTDGAASAMRILAASPGAWANTLTVAVYPDLTAGGGRLYASEIRAVATNLNTGTGKVVTVASTAGVAIGDAVTIVTGQATSGNAIAAAGATVTAVDTAASTVTLTVGATNGTFAAGRTFLAASLANAAANARLVSGGGIRRGDVVRLVSGTRAVAGSAVVEAATAAQPGLALTLSGTTLASALNAIEFGPRVERFTGTVGAATNAPALPFAGITAWDQTPAPVVSPARADVVAGHTATLAGGMVGTWNTGSSAFDFPGNVPAGRVEVEAIVMANAFAQDVALADPTLDQITERFGFVPVGGFLRLDRTAPAANVTLTRTAGGWTGGPITGTWDRATATPPADGANGILVQSAFEPRTTDYLGTAANTALPITSVERVTPGLYLIRTAAGAPGAGPWQLRTFVPAQVTPQRFAITASDGLVTETFTNLALHRQHPNYAGRDDQVNDVSRLIRVTERPENAPVTLAAMPVLATPRTPGTSAVASAADLRAGFALLERVTEPAMVVCPDAVTLDELEQSDVIGAMITHCEEFRRFAVVDAPRGMTDTELADWRLRTVSSTHAAVYAPWLRILNLNATSARRVVDVPPSGFVAGVFARTDRERGVHKAPANERVRGIVGLAVDYTQRQQDLLNPAGVNLVRTFPGRGMRIWGARNATDDVQWRYVNVRRLFNMIEISVERSTQWVVFEPNTASTWLRIRVSVEDFLDQLFRSGALAGASPEEAYRVRVGLGETMSEADIDLGLVITEVAVAPAKPAEFVVFRFSHKRITE